MNRFDTLKKKCTEGAIYGLIFCLLAVGFIMLKEMDEKRDRNYEHITECIESGYTLYVDGEETDVLHITLENYSLSAIDVHDDIKEVHITAQN